MRVDQIEIHAGKVDFDFEPIRRLEAKCEARTNFSKTPTIADANAKLQELAAGLGADAVVDVSYDSGMSMTSWRSLKATGLAVKRISDEVACPRCAEMIKRAAKVCRFCGSEMPTNGVENVELSAAHRDSNSNSRATPEVARSIPAEPLRATDNSQVGIVVAIGVVILFAIIGAMSR